METKSLYSQESWGNHGAFKIEITVGATKLPKLDGDEGQAIRYAAYDAAKLIQAAIMTEIIKSDPKAQEQAATERKQLLALFPGQPFVEEIPNGYCSDYCCKHLPWFIVTTQVGRIKIGWRKRVILIDWSETRGTKNSAELFSGEDVTTGERMIHAWSYEKAGAYIKAILTGVPLGTA